MKYYVVKYEGTFGYIKPWTAVRDDKTFSQQFLTPSIIEGIEKKLFPELLSLQGIQKIVRHKLNYVEISEQLERTQSKGVKTKKTKGQPTVYEPRERSILHRGIMIEPNLYLAFATKEDAEVAFAHTICLCRNEDIVFPMELIEVTDEEFEVIEGFELLFNDSEFSFIVGYNRFKEGEVMKGELKVTGNPIRKYQEKWSY